jgi:hypothetical protein
MHAPNTPEVECRVSNAIALFGPNIGAAMPGAGQVTSKPKAPPAETLEQKGAIALAKRLEQYWHAQGFPAARFWAEPIGERFEKVGTYELYRVARNLVNGLPPRYLDQDKSLPF